MCVCVCVCVCVYLFGAIFKFVVVNDKFYCLLRPVERTVFF